MVLQRSVPRADSSRTRGLAAVLRVVGEQSLAHGTIERVHGARAPGCGMDHLPVHAQLHHRLRSRLASAPPLDDHREPEQLERRPIIRRGAPDQHLE